MVQQTAELFQAHLQLIELKCRQVRQQYPTWPQNDTRGQVLERLWYVTASVAGLVVASDLFTHGAWWRTNLGLRIPEEQGKNLVQNSQAVVKLAWVVISFSVEETTLRKLYWALKSKEPPRDMSKVYKAVLNEARIPINPMNTEQQNAFELFRLTRNSMHNNSVHTLEDVDVQFAGHTFPFRKGHRVEYADYPILINMMDSVQDLVLSIVLSPTVKNAPQIIDDPAAVPGITPVPLP